MEHTGCDLELHIELTASELYRFLMRHTYLRFSGIIGLVISLGSWLVCLLLVESLDMMERLVLLIIGCLFTIVQPIMLYIKAKTQIMRNKNIQDELVYLLTEEGITVMQGVQEGTVKWYEVRRLVETKRAAYVYMSPVRAFIFPSDQCEGKFEQLCSYIRGQLEKYQEYDPAQVEEPEDAESNMAHMQNLEKDDSRT